MNDKTRARQSVKWAVKAGKLPQVSTVPCVDCGNPASGYDHFMGYERAHWRDVQAVCGPCHGNRSSARGERPSGESHGSKTHPERWRRGSDHYMARLDAPRVRGMRALFAVGVTIQELAEMYKVAWSTASHVVKRDNWRHVE